MYSKKMSFAQHVFTAVNEAANFVPAINHSSPLNLITMKVLKSFLLVALFAIVSASCKKENDNPPFIIEGSWEGKLGTGSAQPTSFIGLNLKSNGVLERLGSSGSISATGTWQLTGNNFTGAYTFTDGVSVTLTATTDKANNKLSGTWVNSGNNTGTWYVSKK